MLKSMTGYGKAEAVIEGSKYIVEIRSLNGKNADITLKTSLIPREKELEVRQMLTEKLNRGTIDLFITVEREGAGSASTINKDVLLSYLGQVSDALSGTAWDTTLNGEASATMLSSVLRMPDVLESTRTEMTGANWELLFGAIKEAAARLDEFRSAEGATLKRDILSKVDMIESCIPQVEKFEKERIDTVRSRIGSRLDEIKVQVDQNRLEQEIILYIDKLDINEEKVRLGQHCRYFRETADGDPFPGKKLGFIAQEMGREINTLGSKANHAEIQKIVVLMKAELEKIKEQSMNVL
ncbi:MAG: YicC family protein [Bacteroidales bacterium]|nr:YicC family protein [Bacteroidales bacterium]